MKKLKEKNSPRVLDLLNERLAFERAGVKLYDQILARMRASSSDNIRVMYDEMQRHREEEKEHEEWLEDCIRMLGGDAHSPSEHSVLVQKESTGIEQVVAQDENVAHDLHALLTAELADNAGWDLLTQIADELGDHEAKREFKKRLHEEEDHLLFVRKAVTKLALQDVTGEPQRMPSSSGILEGFLGK